MGKSSYQMIHKVLTLVQGRRSMVVTPTMLLTYTTALTLLNVFLRHFFALYHAGGSDLLAAYGTYAYERGSSLDRLVNYQDATLDSILDSSKGVALARFVLRKVHGAARRSLVS